MITNTMRDTVNTQFNIFLNSFSNGNWVTAGNGIGHYFFKAMYSFEQPRNSAQWEALRELQDLFLTRFIGEFGYSFFESEYFADSQFNMELEQLTN